MIIDFHTHLFPDKIAAATIEVLASRAKVMAYSDGTASALLNSMNQAKVDCSVVLPVVTKPEQFGSLNRFASQINENYSNKESAKLISFGGIHPDSAHYKEELREIVKMGFLGIKLHPDYQDTMIDNIRNMRIIDYASELGLMISVHAGIDVGLPDVVHCKPKAALTVIKEVAPEKFILAHLGGWKMWDQVEEYLVGEKVYFDTAVVFDYIEQKQFLKIVRGHGSEKILFASDSPWSGQLESYQSFCNMPITQEEKDNILYKNALRLLEE
jgi:uncharacterized protein